MPLAVQKLPSSRKANKADLAVFFDVASPTIDGWIRRGCPFIQQGKQGTSWIFDLKDVARWHFGRDEPDEKNPEDMPPKARKDWYEGEKTRVALELQNGNLVTLDEYRKEMAAILKDVAAMLETLPDVLERKCGLHPDAVLVMQSVLDETRTALADKIVNE